MSLKYADPGCTMHEVDPRDPLLIQPRRVNDSLPELTLAVTPGDGGLAMLHYKLSANGL